MHIVENKSTKGKKIYSSVLLRQSYRAQSHAACDVLNITRGFDENDLYENLSWLTDNKPLIEDRLFFMRRDMVK